MSMKRVEREGEDREREIERDQQTGCKASPEARVNGRELPFLGYKTINNGMAIVLVG